MPKENVQCSACGKTMTPEEVEVGSSPICGACAATITRTSETGEELRAKRCRACEVFDGPLTEDEARQELKSAPGWRLSEGSRQIFREWDFKDFRAAMDFLDRVAQLAEDEGHHPELHLTGYRHVSIAISTHSLGGLSENDFILAAKIDALPVALKR